MGDGRTKVHAGWTRRLKPRHGKWDAWSRSTLSIRRRFDHEVNTYSGLAMSRLSASSRSRFARGISRRDRDCSLLASMHSHVLGQLPKVGWGPCGSQVRHVHRATDLFLHRTMRKISDPYLTRVVRRSLMGSMLAEGEGSPRG
jgi:hypothetical protein